MDENKEKLARRNCKALKLLYQTVHKDLHNDILANDTSFVDAYDALASTCGQDSVIVVCSSFRKLHQMKYQPGSSLSEHIAKFKSAYTRLIDQTMNHMPEFGTVTSFQATAFFLDSLDNDTDLTPIIQTCYDLRPFDLKTVTDRVNFEAMRRTNRVEQQNSVMMATSSNPSSKPNKKKNKQSDAPRPKAVAPTINNSVSKSVSGNPSSSNKNQSMSDPIDNRFKSLEKSVSELTDLVKKLVSNNMVGMVHGQESGSQSTSGPFDVESDRSNFFVGTVQHSSREYYSRFLVFDTGATQSCVINLELLTDVQPLTNHFMNTFSSPIEATHVGTLKIGDYFINPVYHVPNGCANILSASQLIDHGLKPHFKTDQFLLKGGDKIVATFPRIGRLSSSSDSSDDKSSVSDESVAHRSPDPLQDDNHQTSDSDVSFETEAAEVFRRGQKKKELARRQNQSGETERPNNVNDSSNGPPNQGRHYSLSNTALNRLKPSWEYVSDHHPAKEIRGNVDASNILQNVAVSNSSSFIVHRPAAGYCESGSTGFNGRCLS
ncbi:hypothetical protein PSHT_07155 [Puccinia striiformis]|uniref:Uncharacterized protein n=1 Tax=Puccinia striiformis TaxID=27350 RepID=A0A2S4W0M3_9BASI|nr:hypothetical protein PSHT_07155 [Puccinia striiformis]